MNRRSKQYKIAKKYHDRHFLAICLELEQHKNRAIRAENDAYEYRLHFEWLLKQPDFPAIHSRMNKHFEDAVYTYIDE